MSDPFSTGRFELSRTPAELGFRMPAEWYPHESTWLAWPKDPTTWPDRLQPVQHIFLHMIAQLASLERVDLLVDNEETTNEIKAKLKEYRVSPDSVVFHENETAGVWIRDYGPNFLIRQRGAETELALNDWKFNAWGNKYPELEKDGEIPQKLAPFLQAPTFCPGLVLEGGSIDVNGKGSCLTTEQCLLNPNRNAHLSREQIEQSLKDYLGVQQIIWLGQGIIGDDTDGHIDEVARFVGPRTIVCALEQDPADENYRPLQDNYRRLHLACDPEGYPFEIVPLPMPGRVEGSDGPLPASYTNFYTANGVVLVPTFGHPHTQQSLQVLQTLFPNRKVTGINCEPLVWGMGNLHCVTQQQPARVEVGPARTEKPAS